MSLEDQSKKLERLRELYQNDPVAGEELAREILEDHIKTIPEERQRKVRGTQFKIDAALSKYKDPVARMNKMVELFWEGVIEFEKGLRDPQSMQHPQQNTESGNENETDNVVNIFGKKDDR